MDIFEWTENTPVTATNMNNMQNIINANITEKSEEVSTWKYAGGTIANNILYLPSSFKELLVVIKVADNNNVKFCINIPEDDLAGTYTSYNAGYYQGASVNAHARVNVSTSEIALTTARLNNGDVLNTTNMKVYYK